MAKKFVDEFAVDLETKVTEEVADYDAFPNKVLLEKLRNEIM